MNEEPCELEGSVKTTYLKDYSENIKSENIVFFSYSCCDFTVSCKKKNNKLEIISKGGDIAKRDGTAFSLSYGTTNVSFLNKLQQIIKDNNISDQNGLEHHVNGLPAGLGDTIEVEYDSNERIYKSSNQYPTITEEAAQDIYNVFHTLAKENNLEFNTEKSNVEIYDDATTSYLQGTWKGTHFGKEYIVIFKNNNVKIYCDGNLTDDTEYTIIRGSIRSSKLKEGITNPKDEHDYEEFSTISSFRKKNDILIVAYFTKESYSTCELLKQKEDTHEQ